MKGKGWVEARCPPDDDGPTRPNKVDISLPKEAAHQAAESLTKFAWLALYFPSRNSFSIKLKVPMRSNSVITSWNTKEVLEGRHFQTQVIVWKSDWKCTPPISIESCSTLEVKSLTLDLTKKSSAVKDNNLEYVIVENGGWDLEPSDDEEVEAWSSRWTLAKILWRCIAIDYPVYFLASPEQNRFNWLKHVKWDTYSFSIDWNEAFITCSWLRRSLNKVLMKFTFKVSFFSFDFAFN